MFLKRSGCSMNESIFKLVTLYLLLLSLSLSRLVIGNCDSGELIFRLNNSTNEQQQQQQQQQFAEHKTQINSRQNSQEWPKIGPDLEANINRDDRLQKDSGQKATTTYRLVASNNSQIADKLQQTKKEKAAAAAATTIQQRNRRDQNDAQPFITVSDNVQTHLSAANQLQQRINNNSNKQKVLGSSSSHIGPMVIQKERSSSSSSSSISDRSVPIEQQQVDTKQQSLLIGFDSFYSSPGADQHHQQLKKPKDSEQQSLSLDPATQLSSISIHNEASHLTRHKVGKLVSAAGHSGAPYGARKKQTPDEQTQYNQFNQLYLDTGSIPLEVAAHVGQTANLVCRLRSLHNHSPNHHQQQQQQQRQQDQPGGLQVSWRRNMQILTSGLSRFTSDERFQASHVSGSNDWLLEIHNVQPSDEGSYECQVNSEPKAASVSLFLRVMVASIEIIEAQRMTTLAEKQKHIYVEEDDQIRLTCRVEFNSATPTNVVGISELDESVHLPPNDLSSSSQLTELVSDQDQDHQHHQQRRASSTTLTSQHYIFWYKNGVSLEYNNPRGSIKVERRNQAFSMEKVLTIEGASSQTDSGIYMCKIQPELSGISPALVQVNVGGYGGGGGVFGNDGSSAANMALSSIIFHLILPFMLLLLVT